MSTAAARTWPLILVAAGFAPAVASRPTAPTRQAPAVPAIAWEAGAGSTAAVLVLNLPATTAEALRAVPATDPRWAATLAVRVVNPDGSVPADRPAVVGKYRVDDGKVLRFTPRFPLEMTRRCRATFDPDGMPGGTPAMVADRPGSRRPTAEAPTVVDRIEPLGDRLPENLLKFYLHFSSPMGRGDAYAHLQLVNAAGKPLDRPFLELGEELWDATQTRLTILLDPGRIKRGLRPREELGPILVADRSYTLKVNASWRDALGRPLSQATTKTFSTTPADDTSPDPRAWKFLRPAVGTSEPLRVDFGEPLDCATVASGLTLLGPDGVEAPGTPTARPDGTGWQFTSARTWIAGEYTLTINPDLEDLAGNSIRRPFEVNVERDTPTTPEATPIRLPILIGR